MIFNKLFSTNKEKEQIKEIREVPGEIKTVNIIIL